jgi:tRNA dimethylallyltransferase
MDECKMTIPIIGIIGPTATGKTAVGIELAKMIGGEIISADSMAVYKGMDIGTAKPTIEEQAEVKFHLIDIIDPDEEFSAVIFRNIAYNIIDDLISKDKIPIVVGGTGLYIKALTGGYNIPEAKPNEKLRDKLSSLAKIHGNEFLLNKLKAIDPITANKLHCNDINRIIRAIEVFSVTGKPISYFHQTEGSSEFPYQIRLFGLSVSRETLYKRIEDRIDCQIKDGFIDEVKLLLENGYNKNIHSMKALGYKHIASFLSGECDFDTAIDLFKRDTRRFAKRQLTWFRGMSEIEWIDAENYSKNEMCEQIIKSIKN